MMAASKSKKTYDNAGAQDFRAFREMRVFWSAPGSDLFTISTIGYALNINRNRVNEIPVKRSVIDKRVYYRKEDVMAWVNDEATKPDGLLMTLQAAQARANARLRKHPSRRHIPGQLSPEEAKQAREKSKENQNAVPDKLEVRIIARKAGAREEEAAETKRWDTMRWAGQGKSAKAARDLLDLWTKPKKSK